MPQTAPANGPSPTVSVVICTTGRIQCLPRTIDSIRQQTYRPLEIIVVVGPCNDGTDRYVADLTDIKIRTVDRLNISAARNEGIRAATGDIVVSIDDDAVADPQWVEELVRVFEEAGPQCAGVGGATFNECAPGGRSVQWRYGLVSDLGEGIDLRLEPGAALDPDGTWFNRLHGTNMAFRRSALIEIGGFDETYEYVHDETDVCVTLIRRGYQILQHGRAWIHHFPSQSHNRKSPFDINWYAVLKNNLYFALKHSRRSWTSCVRSVVSRHLSLLRSFRHWMRLKHISPMAFQRFTRSWMSGVLTGIRIGCAQRWFRKPTPPLADADPPPFLNLTAPIGRSASATRPRRSLRIGLVYSAFGTESAGGIGLYTQHLAEGLSRFGHSVVVVRAGGTKSLIQSERYEIADVPAAPNHRVALFRTLKSLASNCPFDVIEAPLWVGEACAVGLAAQCPLVLRLETPFELVRQVSQLPFDANAMAAVGAERLQLSHAAGAIAISRAIWQSVEELYDLQLATPSRKATVIPLGLPPARDTKLESIDVELGYGPRFLYVGRLEARKGIVELGAAFSEVARNCPTATLWIVGADNSQHDGFAQRSGCNYVEWLRSHWEPEVNRRVRFFNHLSDPARDYLMSQCHIFVAPSRYESFGLVYLEAMRFGKPVVGTLAGGIPEIVENGITGILVRPQDPRELATALIRLANSRSDCEQMGAAALRRFEQKFSVYECALQTERFYRQVIQLVSGQRLHVPKISTDRRLGPAEEPCAEELGTTPSTVSRAA